MKINILTNLILKKTIKKNINIFIFKKFKLIKFNVLFFYNFIYMFINFKLNINSYKKNIVLDNFFLLNLKNKQIKINILDLNKKKKFIYSIGLILNLLNLYKKSNRRLTIMIKYLINFLIKKYLIYWNNKKFLLIIKGLRKNYIKLLYYLKVIIIKLNISFFFLYPLKNFSITHLKKKRSIKKRIYKKLIDFNKL